MRRHATATVLCCAALLLLAAGCAELKDPLPSPVAPTPIVHPPGWGDVTNAGDPQRFHGTYLKQHNWANQECRSCHGGTYLGGSSGVSCYPCHDAYPHEVKFAQAVGGGHVGYLRGKLYPFDDCKQCHGTDYQGGSQLQTQVSCSRVPCHATTAGAAKSPEACNTCHGQFRAAAGDTLGWAPPGALNNDTLTTSRAVGAHQLHLRGSGFTSAAAVPCSGCHNVPSGVFDSGHMDSPGPAEVALTVPLAAIPSGGRSPSPAYDPQTQTCASTYCHGTFRLRRSTAFFTFDNFYTDSVMTGSAAAPRWNGGASEAACGSCHGLPPQGHVPAQLNQCGTCHPGVVNASGQIIDKSKHINGKANIFGQELDFR